MNTKINIPFKKSNAHSLNIDKMSIGGEQSYFVKNFNLRLMIVLCKIY